jgi:hypothetical protein
MDYIKTNKEAWEKAFENRKPVGERTMLRNCLVRTFLSLLQI